MFSLQLERTKGKAQMLIIKKKTNIMLKAVEYKFLKRND